MNNILRNSCFSICKKLPSFFIIAFLLIFIGGCRGGLKETEYQKNREANAVREKIFRLDKDHFISINMPMAVALDSYPWEKEVQGTYSLITKEFFRCKGHSNNPSFLIDSKERLFDCSGSSRHSLPLKDGQEFIHSPLIDLLNYLQKKLNSKVVITCGHRCPQHNRYSDPSESNRTSKHMVGGEVDFYVVGFEKKPEIVVDLLKQYYLENEETQNDPHYILFKRYEKADAHVSTPPWYNAEVYIKICQENEGRDFDNKHPYPYINIQVRQDRKSHEKVTYTWQQAFYNYLRY
ncbi:MAG: hypothetical protein S4CHLAM7_12140 [Chlamydiae bacterium]|nr:hypothetical protein [Chlamydiota bacterium]